MDAAQLLERARHFRCLAECADEQIRGELLYLAEQYEALAREVEQRQNHPIVSEKTRSRWLSAMSSKVSDEWPSRSIG